MTENNLFIIRPMTADDLGQALGLSGDEGWNQTEKDWRLLLENPDNICIVAEKDKKVAGTATAMDRAQAAGDGGFLLGSRVDRIAKIEGKRVSLGKIEGLLTASPLVASARTLSVDGRRQRIAAFVVLSEIGRRELNALGRRGFTRLMRRTARSFHRTGGPAAHLALPRRVAGQCPGQDESRGSARIART